ncbi:MAG: hypothetical protein MUE81_03545 [Thermoflexibacter sp.]|jgi:hypothetical protein|nr:hypothetical protein [Thermoflexibacter sp.]
MNKFFLIVLFITFFSYTTLAQSGNAPYSRLGIGQLSEIGSMYNIGMGGLGVSNGSQAYINLVNPALLTRNTLTAYEAAVFAEYKVISNNNANEKNSTGNLSYLTFAFPLTRHWTLGMGLKPYSSVNYIDKFEQKIPQSPSFIEYSYEGTGGLTQAFLSSGFALTKGLSIGIQANYNFGAISTASISKIIDNQLSYSVALFDQTNFGDLSYKTGIAYRVKIAKETSLNFGATYDLEADLNTKRLRSVQRRDRAGQIFASDTISRDLKGSVVLPAKYGFGISIQRPFRYTFGIDLTLQDWSKFTGLILRDTLQNSQKITIGGEIIPNIESIGNYFARVTYRAGVSYAMLPYLLNGKQLNETSISLGISLPVNRGLSSINFAFIGGQRGGAGENVLKENFFRVHLGLTVNDQAWFYRRKIR